MDLAAATAVPPVFTPRIEAKPDVNATAPYDGAVFSSVAFPIGGLPAKARWQAALAAADRMDFSACATGACPEGRKAVGTAVEAVRGKPVAEQIARVNAVVNHAIAYTRDRESYGKRDYWASPDEALTRGKGDCEDYAITKMAALKAAGIDMNSVALVVLRDVRRRVYHAVLTVSTREGRFVLDNMRDNVLADTDLPDYQALYSLNGSQAFIHGYPASSRLSAGMGAGAAAGSALPGEDTDTNS